MKVHFSMGKAPFSFVVVVLVLSVSMLKNQCFNCNNRKKIEGDTTEYVILEAQVPKLHILCFYTNHPPFFYVILS